MEKPAGAVKQLDFCLALPPNGLDLSETEATSRAVPVLHDHGLFARPRIGDAQFGDRRMDELPGVDGRRGGHYGVVSGGRFDGHVWFHRQDPPASIRLPAREANGLPSLPRLRN